MRVYINSIQKGGKFIKGMPLVLMLFILIFLLLLLPLIIGLIAISAVLKILYYPIRLILGPPKKSITQPYSVKNRKQGGSPNTIDVEAEVVE